MTNTNRTIILLRLPVILLTRRVHDVSLLTELRELRDSVDPVLVSGALQVTRLYN